MSRFIWGIDPGYSEKTRTSGWIVLEVDEGGRLVAVVERGHETSSALLSMLRRIWSTHRPTLIGIDAPLMSRQHDKTPYIGVSCRPQEMVSMQRHFSDNRLKAGHAFTPRGLSLHGAGMSILHSLINLGAVFNQWENVASITVSARNGGAPVVVEAFPKLWLGIQHDATSLTHLTQDSHQRDHAMMRLFLKNPVLVAAHRLETCVDDLRLISNADELAAATSALSATALLFGCSSPAATSDHRDANLLGSALGGHFVLPPAAVWHADHRTALIEAAQAAAQRHPASCDILRIQRVI